MRLRNEGLATRQVGGKTMILDLTSSTYFAVGGAGTAILDLLQTGDLSKDQLVDRLGERFSADREALRSDVDEFIDRLDRAGLLIR